MLRSLCRSNVRGAVSARGHRRRRDFLRKTYPNAPTNEPDTALPRRGSRGAWLSNPSNVEKLGQLEGTNLAQEKWLAQRETQVDLLLDLAGRSTAPLDGDAFTALLDEHIRVNQAVRASQPTAETFVKQHINMLTRKPPENPVYEGHKAQSWAMAPPPFPADDSESTPSAPSAGGRKSARKAATEAAAAEQRPTAKAGAEVVDFAPLRALRTTELADLWARLGAEWAEIQDCIVPSKFERPSIEAYERARRGAALMDASYRNLLLLEGEDRTVCADHFLTASVRPMKSGDARYSLILDTKGYVLDSCFVLKGEDQILILTEGADGVQLLNYLSDYVGYARQSGLDVVIRPEDASVLEVCGPKAACALGGGAAWPFPAEWKRLMPRLSFLRLDQDGGFGGSIVLRSTLSGLPDGFIFIMAPRRGAPVAEEVLQQAEPIGASCYDILRMEGGHPRAGADIRPGLWSPIRCSLAWTVDQAKLRSHVLFGHERIFRHLAKGPAYRRVGFVADGFAHGGCRVYANPSRRPIGEITSAVWSPLLQKRIAMGYVKPEYARRGQDVLFNVLFDLPAHKMTSRRIGFWIRHGNLRSAYRRLVPGKVEVLPFIPHRMRLPEGGASGGRCERKVNDGGGERRDGSMKG